MNIALMGLLLVLYTGETKERHFSSAAMLQRPLFYLVLLIFWILPALSLYRDPQRSSFLTVMNGDPAMDWQVLDEETYRQLPLYVKHFCSREGKEYRLHTRHWCRLELRAEPVPAAISVKPLTAYPPLITQEAVKDSEDHLSAL